LWLDMAEVYEQWLVIFSGDMLGFVCTENGMYFSY